MTSRKPRITISHDGTLVSNLFFKMHVANEDSFEGPPAGKRTSMSVIAKRRPVEVSEIGTMPRYVTALVTGAKKSPPERCPNRCPTGGADHDIGWWGAGAGRLDEVSGELGGGKTLNDSFISADGALIITSQLGERFKASGLRGFELLPFPIVINQSYYRQSPNLVYLQESGKNCLRRWRVEIENNLCPLCREAAIYCPECGWMPVLCQKCFKPAFKAFDYVHEGPDCPSKSQKNLTIVELKNWDGADFFWWGPGNTMITRRALIFLLKAGAAPFIAHSQWACVDGVGVERKAEIDEMLATPIPTARCEIHQPT